MSKRAILYARVSYDDRKNEARNLEGQLEDGRAYCQEKGYQVVAELAEDDRGASGADWDLPKLNEALDMARAGQVDVLVVRELDRFARGLAKQLVVEGEFKRHKVGVEYVMGEYPDTPEGNLLKNTKAVIAEYQREDTRIKITRGRRLAVKDGKVLIHGSAKAPYGYTFKDRQLVICEEEAEVVRQIFNWYVHGDETGQGLSLGDIADRLTAFGFPTWADTRPVNLRKIRGRGEWCRDTLRKMLTSETYIGTWYYGKNGKKKVNPRDHWLAVEVPAIVDRETWEKAQAQRSHNREMSKRNTKNFYLLGRRVTCECGATMIAKKNNYRNTYYFCQNAAGRLAVKDCHAPYFRADRVDTMTWDWLRSIEPGTLWENLRKQRIEQEQVNRHLYDRLAIIDDLLADNRKKRERLLDLYLAGDFEKEVLTDRKTRLETAIAALEKERASLAMTLEAQTLTDEQIEEMADIWVMLDLAAGDFDLQTRRRIIDKLDVRVTLAVEDGQRVAYARCRVGEAALPIESTDIRIRTRA